ncbi:alpha/beta hydrolase family protein [Paenibacillus macerans]|uniref:alpha/beta hydrolase family protein n=1 Tax=Paenibacillus macerans TaxID=44252 RepID=UPI003D319693
MPTDFLILLEDGLPLRCTRFPAKSTPAALILIAHGYKGFKDWGMFPYAAERLSQHHEVVTFNFSHNGIGEEPLELTELERFAVNTRDRELADLHALVLHLRQEESLQELPLFLIGHSLGAGIALVYGLDHPDAISGVISWNGVTSLDLLTAKQKEEMRTAGRSYVVNGRTGQRMPLDKAILDDLERQRGRYDIIPRLTAAGPLFPVVLIQGTEDGAHLRQGSAKLTEARPDIDWVQIPGGNHTFGTVHPFRGPTPQLEQALQASLAFVAERLD